MKRIALTQRIIKNSSYYEIREALDVNWGALIDATAFEPLVLPLQYDFKKLHFDGLVLTGGNDLSIVSGNTIDKMRDEFEKSLIDYCILSGIPVFGICRGMQMINHYFGGTLKKIEHHTGTSHLLDDGREVNSYHGYAVDRLGKELTIIARSDDGIIEIMRHDNYKIYAQMYHPERINPFNESDVNFIMKYFNGDKE